MAFTFDLCVYTDRPYQAPYTFKEKLKSLGGWTVVESGDGAGTYSGPSGGDVLTTYHDAGSLGSNLSGSINNTDAWYRMQAPDGGREFVYQAGAFFSDSAEAQITYSAKAGFTGGSPGSSTRPTATDEVELFGSPQPFSSGFGGSSAGSRRNVFDFIIGDAEEDYAFFALSRPMGFDSVYSGGMMIDAVEPIDPNNDEDPAVLYVPGGRNVTDLVGGATKLTPDNPAPYAWRRQVKAGPEERGMVQHSLLVMVPVSGTSGRGKSSFSALNPFDGRLEVMPAYWVTYEAASLYGNYKTPAVMKGKSKFFFHASAGSSIDSAMNAPEDLSYFVLGEQDAQNQPFLAVRWDGQTIPYY